MRYMLLPSMVHAKRALDVWLLRLSAIAVKSLVLTAAILVGSSLANADSTQRASPPAGEMVQGQHWEHRLLEAELAGAAEQQDVALREERRLLKSKLSQLQEQFERWAEAFSRGVMSEKQFQTFSGTMAQEEENATARLAQIERDLEGRQQREAWMASVRDALLDFPPAWDELDNDEKRQVLSLLLEEDQLRVDRHGRDLHLSLKIYLLPPVERVIAYQSQRGKKRTRAKGVERLSRLYYAGQGHKKPQIAPLMGCSSQSLYSVQYTICRKLDGVSWLEAIEMARETVEPNLAQLQLDVSSSNRKTESAGGAST